MATNGLNNYGFTFPTFEEISSETKQSLKNVFGESLNTESNSVLDKIVSVLSEREYQQWLLMASVFSSQTMQGAEGIYLDDLFGKRGIYRRGRTKATGDIALTMDNTVDYYTILSKEDYTIDEDYVLTTDVQMSGNIIAQKILNKDLNLGDYIFYIFNQNVNETRSLSLTLTDKGTSSQSLNNFLNAIKSFIVDNTIASNEDRIFIDSASGSLYIGYDTSFQIIGLNARIDFKSTPAMGDKTFLASVIAKEAGARQKDVYSVTTISPEPAGFVAITNIKPFNSGSDIESDTEYRARATSTAQTAMAATRPAIISRLLNEVEGVEKVKIFDNPTPHTNSLGIPPFKFNTVVYGGTTEDISRMLYQLIACSNATYGAVGFEITTEDSQTEWVFHTKAESRPLSLLVKYRGSTLSSTEKNTITTALLAVFSGTDIGGTIYNTQLTTAVGSAINIGRFKNIEVLLKDVTAPDADFSSDDFIAEYNQVPVLSAINISFVQEV